MTANIYARNVPEAYWEGLNAIKIRGVEEESRAGTVFSIPYPVTLEIKYPWERVLFDPKRDANPFFHVMEFVWMIAGSNDAHWLSQFNKRMMEYSDDGVLRGAYGWRWQNPQDQIPDIISLLGEDPETRQAVLSMWDVLYDGPTAKSSDRPCNTHIYFRVAPDGVHLDMTVCNRSNDLIWGMMGANAVHMTMLHELVARAAGYQQGVYRVFTNNLHAYREVYEPLMDNTYGADNRYKYQKLDHFPLLQKGETFEDFRMDCEALVSGSHLNPGMTTNWMLRVAWPMYNAYLSKNTGENRDEWVSHIAAPDWQLVCQEWCARRTPVV